MKIKVLSLLALLFIAFAIKASEPVNRSQAPENLKWRLTDIYSGPEAWFSDLEKAELIITDLAKQKGTLGQSSNNLLNFMKQYDELGKLITTLYCYSYLEHSLDSRDPIVNDRYQRIQSSLEKAGQALAWVTPEMVEIPENTTMQWVKLNKEFAPYRFSLENMYRLQEHVLPAEQEQLVSYFSGMAGSASSIYSEVTVSDNVYPQFIRSTGDTITLTRSALNNILNFSEDRDERKRAYESFSECSDSRKNTMAALLNSVCKTDWAYAQAYKFDNTLQASLNSNNIPVSVYESLIQVARENTQPLQRYINLRKKVLGLQDYAPWDGSVSLGTFNRTYTYAEATELIKKALQPLGKEYTTELNKALEGGWIDVYEGEAKQTGAYSMGIYGVHPYILLNYDQTTDAVSTMAHELGHTMHSVFSSANQPYKTHDYSSFVAEVASNFNEELLLDYMLSNSADKHERIALLDQAINNLIGSFYRQSQFADFELQVHRLVETGQPVNATILNNIFAELNKTYYGETVSAHPYRNLVWAQVMHFYELQYYVYQYATSYAAASRIHQLISTGTPQQRELALKNYLNLLKSGGNDYPVEQLRKAGVDMNMPEPTLAVVKRLNDLIDLLEKELLS